MKKTILLAVGVVVICLALVLTLVTCRNNEGDTPTGAVDGVSTTTTANEKTEQTGNQAGSQDGGISIDISDLLPGVSTTAKTSYVTVTDGKGQVVTTYVPVTDSKGSTKTTYVAVTDAKGSTKTTNVPVTNAQGATKTDAQGSVETTVVAQTTAVVQTTAVAQTTAVTVTDPTTTTTKTEATTTTKAETGTTTINYDSIDGWSDIKPPK